jgi:hypothetical protein
MKKLLAIIALSASTSVFAASFTVEHRSIENVGTSNDQSSISMVVRENITKNLAADVRANTVWNDTGVNALHTSRIEAGLTATTPLYGPVSGYARIGVGQKFNTKGNFSYYSIEPGISVPVASTGFTAKLGYRYRNAFDIGNNDQSDAVRTSLSYRLSDKDSVSLGYDRIRGDQNQNQVRVGYTRSF